MSCADDLAAWPPDGALFDDPDGEFPIPERYQSFYRKGRHRPVDTVTAIDDYQPTGAGQPERDVS